MEEVFDLSKPHISREQIKSILGMRPKNLDYYRRALVHKSLQRNVKENIQLGNKVQDYMRESNETLEFLGDAVLNLVVGNLVYHKFSNKDEGFLTRMRTKIVRGSNCANFAKELGLGEYILTGNKVIRVKDSSGKINNDRVLEDAFESFIGAIFEDLGYIHAEKFILNLIDKHIDFTSLLKDDNYKDILMRYSQSFGYELPVYKTIEVNGPPHNRKFVVSLSLKKSGKEDSELKEFGIGEGSSKKTAEQNAAKSSICRCNNKKCNKIHMSELNGIIDRDY